MCAGAHEVQKGGSVPLDLELQLTESCPTQMLGTKYSPTGRTTSSFKHGAF